MTWTHSSGQHDGLCQACLDDDAFAPGSAPVCAEATPADDEEAPELCAWCGHTVEEVTPPALGARCGASVYRRPVAPPEPCGAPARAVRVMVGADVPMPACGVHLRARHDPFAWRDPKEVAPLA